MAIDIDKIVVIAKLSDGSVREVVLSDLERKLLFQKLKQVSKPIKVSYVELPIKID